MRRITRVGLAVVLLVGIAGATRSQPAQAAANPWPHTAVNGFSTLNGGGFWLVYGDGSVTAVGNAPLHGDASGLALSRPVVGGTVAPSGSGYWLVASDGGIFTFGDGHFYGSTGGIKLNQPIHGITTSPTGKGYRLVAHDGGIFSFGNAPFYGSLPGLGVSVTDVVGTASSPTNKGYWIAKADGAVHAFGEAHNLSNYTPSLCDPVTGIFSNPKAQGYRLVLQSDATIPFGTAPGGKGATGTPHKCSTPPPPLPPANPGTATNCSDFATWNDANAWFQTHLPYYGDVAHLDADGDGIPCESLSGGA